MSQFIKKWCNVTELSPREILEILDLFGVTFSLKDDGGFTAVGGGDYITPELKVVMKQRRAEFRAWIEERIETERSRTRPQSQNVEGRSSDSPSNISEAVAKGAATIDALARSPSIIETPNLKSSESAMDSPAPGNVQGKNSISAISSASTATRKSTIQKRPEQKSLF